MRRKRLVLAMLLVVAGLRAQASGRLVDVNIVDRDSGAIQRTYHHAGETWIAGIPGARYAIAMRSRSGERVLAVTSVDGVNVLNGETAAWDQSGYVLSPWQRYQITGWRKSDREVAAFTYSSASHSYAGLTGRPDHVGVIGVAVFLEKPAEPVARAPEPSSRFDSDAPARRESAGNAPAPATRQDDARARSANEAERGSALADQSGKSLALTEPRLGTGHGRRETSWASHTRFDRLQDRPHEIIRIRYDSRENLIASGVIPMPLARTVPAPANPFPGSAQASYVPDPPRVREWVRARDRATGHLQSPRRGGPVHWSFTLPGRVCRRGHCPADNDADAQP